MSELPHAVELTTPLVQVQLTNQGLEIGTNFERGKFIQHIAYFMSCSHESHYKVSVEVCL